MQIVDAQIHTWGLGLAEQLVALAGDAFYSGRGDPADGRGRRRCRGHPPAALDPNSTALALQAVRDYPRRFGVMGAHDLLFQPPNGSSGT